MFQKMNWILLITVAALMSACGGGGGGGGGGEGGGLPPNNLISTPTPVISGPPVTVQGTVRYERVGILAAGGLDYTNITPQPVRGATVELLFGASVLATTKTNHLGAYSFTSAPGNNTLSVRVRAELKQTTGAAQWDVTVRDNTNSDALYTLSSTFNSGTGTVQNLTAGSGWTGLFYGGVRSAGPFAILDTIYESHQKVLQANANSVFPPLQVFWSINNSTASGNLALGNIGTSFFTDSNSLRRIFILGKANDDTDEYDASVVAHEWGHYYQSAFSRDDSTGGSHGRVDDRLDRRIAFSEGWGNALSGIVLARSDYTDSSGSGQTDGFVITLNSGYSGAGSAGWFRSRSIQYILWDMNRQAGFAPLHTAMTNNTFRTGAPLSDIHSFASAFKATASGTQTAALNTLLTSESINSNSNAYGNNESNDGGSTVTLPYYREATVANPAVISGGNSVCITGQFAGATEYNKLGQFAYVRFTPASQIVGGITVSTGTPGVDVDFEVYRGATRLLLSETASGGTETAFNIFTATEHVLVIYDFNNIAGQSCYTISFQ